VVAEGMEEAGADILEDTRGEGPEANRADTSDGCISGIPTGMGGPEHHRWRIPLRFGRHRCGAQSLSAGVFRLRRHCF
jgi:hypothetical protein